ncbi:MAG: hypothetical protein ACKVKH_16170, partial [Verrucomicrobiales bacterium]
LAQLIDHTISCFAEFRYGLNVFGFVCHGLFLSLVSLLIQAGEPIRNETSSSGSSINEQRYKTFDSRL